MPDAGEAAWLLSPHLPPGELQIVCCSCCCTCCQASSFYNMWGKKYQERSLRCQREAPPIHSCCSFLSVALLRHWLQASPIRPRGMKCSPNRHLPLILILSWKPAGFCFRCTLSLRCIFTTYSFLHLYQRVNNRKLLKKTFFRYEQYEQADILVTCRGCRCTCIPHDIVLDVPTHYINRRSNEFLLTLSEMILIMNFFK